MKLINIFVALILSLFLIACTPDSKITVQRERTFDATVTVTDIGHFRSGNVYIVYIIDGYSKYKTKASGDKSCLPDNKIYIGSRLVLPVPINKSTEYPTGYIDPPTDLCLISSISMKLEERK